MSSPGSTGTNDKAGNSKPSPIEVMSNVADKLTDVLNLGRVLSIGVPGFVAAFGVLLLLARISPFEIPRKDLYAVQTLIPEQSWAAADSTIYYDQLPHNQIPLQVQELKVANDFRTVMKDWYIWFIVAIMMGCVIGVWGYYHLMKRVNLRDAWQRLLDETLRRKPEAADKLIRPPTALPKADRLVFSRPRCWCGLFKRIEAMEPLWVESKDELRKIQRQALGAELGAFDAKYSWTNLHIPLMGNGPTPGMTCWDYLVKEYWRFVEFAVNFPIALFLCMGFLGIYCLSLSWPPHFLGCLGILLFVLAFFGFVFLYLWTDSVVLNSYDQYEEAAHGIVAGLMLFTPPDGPRELERLGVSPKELGQLGKITKSYLKTFEKHLETSEERMRAKGAAVPSSEDTAGSRTDITGSQPQANEQQNEELEPEE